MSGTNRIRWRESDNKELRRITKNYNAKITRQRKKLIEADRRYEASQLPSKVSVRELRRNIETRRDFNSEISNMKNFIKTGNKIQLDGNTKKSLHAVVRDFNSKVTRLQRLSKTQGERAALPEKLSVKDLLRNASSKEALIRDISDYKGFLKRGAEKLVELPDTKFNIKLTRWQKETMEKRIGEINEARAKELEAWRESDVKYGGKAAGYKQGQIRMDTGDFDQFEPMKLYNYSSTYGSIREKFKLMIRESQPGYWDARTELARINYTELMDEVIGDHPIGNILLKQIKSMPLTDFKRVLLSEDDMWRLLYNMKLHPNSGNQNELLEMVFKEWNPDKDMYEELDAFVDRRAKKL